ncbi:MAG: redox-regulated ATPase YchF [Deltaproteobacteria bacterium]
MRVGLFGNAGAGKSTLFRALSGGGEESGGGRKGPPVCTVKVPDDRVDRLAALFRPKKVTYLSIVFTEIDPGETALLPPETLAALKQVEVLALLLRGFADDFHPPPPGGLDPLAEFRSIESDLVVSDYLVAQKRIERMTKEGRRDAEWNALHKVIGSLEEGVPVRELSLSEEERRILAGFRFASQIPLILVLNVGEEAIRAEPYPDLAEAARAKGIPMVRLCAKVEEEISRLSVEDQAEFLREMGIARSARDQLIRGSFEAMQYISFLTVGEDEVRAWNIRRGTTAVAAAGKIHSDLEKGFIRAEVIGCEEFFRFGSLAKAKADGALRLEGKEYVVRDGEILHVRFHV